MRASARPGHRLAHLRQRIVDGEGVGLLHRRKVLEGLGELGTAGRSSFITGQSVYRTGLSKVGIPAAPTGMNDKLVTIAALLKERATPPANIGP